jgi:transposase
VSKGENQECLFEGLIAIFDHIGGVPPKIWFDNTKTIVTNLYYLQLNHSPSSWVVRQQRLHSRTLVGHQLPNPNFRLQKPAPLRLMYQG